MQISSNLIYSLSKHWSQTLGLLSLIVRIYFTHYCLTVLNVSIFISLPPLHSPRSQHLIQFTSWVKKILRLFDQSNPQMFLCETLNLNRSASAGNTNIFYTFTSIEGCSKLEEINIFFCGNMAFYIYIYNF